MRDKEMELGRLSVVVHEEFHAQVAVNSVVRLQGQGIHMVVLKEHSLLLLSARNDSLFSFQQSKYLRR
jgi:hypothetical protein